MRDHGKIRQREEDIRFSEDMVILYQHAMHLCSTPSNSINGLPSTNSLLRMHNPSLEAID